MEDIHVLFADKNGNSAVLVFMTGNCKYTVVWEIINC